MFKEITEGAANVIVPQEQKISRELEVFYNPIMQVNRDMSILVLKSWERENLRVCLPLAGTGIRACRFLQELPKNKIEELHVNDYDEKAVEIIQKNIKKNNTEKKVIITQKEANICLLNQKGFDHIDIDPFGSPNPFLDAALKRIKHNSILAITATDTSALSGTYETAGKRKYWGKGLRNHLMHEIGLRILIRKAQLIGAQYEKALKPIVSYTHEHYMKVFFLCEKAKAKCNKMLNNHKYFLFCKHCTHTTTSLFNKEQCICGKEYSAFGPIYTGPLNDEKFIEKMIKNSNKNISPQTMQLLQTLQKETATQQIGFYAPAGQAKYISHKNWLKFEKIQEQLAKKGYNFATTHFQKMAFKTNAPFETVMQIMFKD